MRDEMRAQIGAGGSENVEGAIERDAVALRHPERLLLWRKSDLGTRIAVFGDDAASEQFSVGKCWQRVRQQPNPWPVPALTAARECFNVEIEFLDIDACPNSKAKGFAFAPDERKI